MQPAGDHQMEHEPEISFYSDGDALADAPQFTHDAALCVRGGRLRGSKKKRACQPDALDGLADDARLERVDVGGDVRQLWQLSG